MIRVLALALVAAIATPAFAQEPPQAATYRDRSGSYQSAQATFCLPAKDGSGCSTAASGPQPAASSQSVTPATGGSPFPVVGNVAHNSADSGNPVKIGGVANAGTPTAITNGNRSDLWLGSSGQVIIGVQGGGPVGATYGAVGLMADQMGSFRPMAVGNYVLQNGTDFVAQRGDVTGTYVVSRGSGSIATGQVTVGTTATLIRAADTGRSSISVIVGAATACAFGNSSVTLLTGYALPATAGATDTTATSAALYGVCSATTTVSFKAVLP